MKIVVFKGGVGNQLFQYQLCCKLKGNGHRVQIIDGCGRSHNGFELDKYFNVEIKFCSRFFVYLFFKICALPNILKHRFVIEEKSYTDSFPLLYYNDYWQDRKFFPKKCTISFKNLSLNELNKKILEKIQSTESISIHIRRGDYLDKGISDIFVNLSKTDYYTKSIEYICNLVSNPTFFIFSNDIEEFDFTQ